MCFYSANAEVMRARVVCFALIIAQVTSLEPRRWCTRCHVPSTAATVPHVLGQTTHHCDDRHDRVDVCSCTQPRLLVGAAPRVQLRMKLGAQEVQAALRHHNKGSLEGSQGLGPYCYSTYTCRCSALSTLCCGLGSARTRTKSFPRAEWMRGACAYQARRHSLGPDLPGVSHWHLFCVTATLNA